MFKKDKLLLGIIIGVIAPAFVYGIILLINFILVQTEVTHIYLGKKSHIVLSIAGNLLPIRYYFVNVRLDKTGRGILLITFILIILFFAFERRIV